MVGLAISIIRPVCRNDRALVATKKNRDPARFGGHSTTPVQPVLKMNSNIPNG